jgi:hypothetical protein
MLISFNSEGEVFASRDIEEGISYKITAEHIRYELDGFSNYLDTVQSQYTGNQYDYDELFNENYTKEFDNVPEGVWQLAQELTSGIQSDYHKALKIKSYLEDGFSYTLSPEIPPEDMDFVSHFLQTKRGYCTYYATAMAVLARCAGLPSRYIEGYKVDIEYTNTEVVVTQENAHAWAEIFIEGFGWLPFDPVTFAEISQSGEAPAESVPEDFIPETTPMPEIESEPVQEKNVNIFPYIIIIAIILSIIILLLLFVFVSFYTTSYPYIRHQKKSGNKIAMFYYSETMILFSYLNYKKPIGYTLDKYAQGVDNLVILNEFKFKEMILIINKLLYSKTELSETEIKYIHGYYKALKSHIKKYLGTIKYLHISVSMKINSLLQKKKKRF